jgi:hypothetical protein
MLSHKSLNAWHEGLLKLFGYMEPQYWSILWALAENADDNGHVQMTDEQIADAVVRYRTKTMLIMNEMKRLGIIRVARKRKMHRMVKGQPYRQKHPRTLEIYAGIRDGKLPPVKGVNKIRGLVPSWHYKGHKVKWQTHKLIRGKFKAKKHKPQYEDHGKLSRLEYMRLKPSASYRRRKERERVQRLYEIETKKRHTRALNFYYY